MARPIWTGTLSFGLLNVPVSLMPAERSTDLHFRMLDSRSNTPIRYERVNAETGEEVPWKEIVKAFEYEKGNYVVLDAEDIKAAAPESHEVVEVASFVDAASIGPEYFEKPYFLVPGKKSEKGYVLLRETLQRLAKVGIARVVIRTREYLAAVLPRGDALMIELLRYRQELVDADSYRIPEGKLADYRISAREVEMASQLIESMSEEWDPANYRDEFRKRLHGVIEKRLSSRGVVTATEDEDDAEHEPASTNVVDFMALLRDSLASKRRTPARKKAGATERTGAKKRKTRARRSAPKAQPGDKRKQAGKRKSAAGGGVGKPASKPASAAKKKSSGTGKSARATKAASRPRKSG